MQKKVYVEEAKNGKYTCKYLIEGKWKYLYSKYRPEENIKDIPLDPEAECYIVLGLGMGYELDKISKQTSKPIIVIEYEIAFLDELLRIKRDEVNTFSTKVDFYFGIDYKQINPSQHRVQVIINENLIQCNLTYYNNVIKYFSSLKRTLSKVVCAFEHPTIIKDCIDAFEQLNYKVHEMPWNSIELMKKQVALINPDIIFSINYSDKIAKISDTLDIPYVSWTVDTPAYSLYKPENISRDKSYYFVYDERVVEHLKKSGVRQVFYLPVAANVERLERVVLNTIDLNKYSTQVSFVGSSGLYNEFSSFIKPKLSKEILSEINRILNIQSKSEEYILSELLDITLLNKIEQVSQYKINTVQHTLLSPLDKLGFILGRYHTYIERIAILWELHKRFDLRIYGDESWLTQGNKFNGVFKGLVEHYEEMPKVFKRSKININITRCFVESGLPMRVFDVLGSKGFLISNYKDDISRLFNDGKDLVVYRDRKDLIDQINYYLINDKERQRIKYQGFETVTKYHTYIERIKKMMDILSDHPR
ncbi:glycosyltransferase [Rossellomorea vietnamensis]|uniref:Glycosyltransferase n=1 Tax=Rossellomorea vietnamensis TaxID=218284 RepID=A0ACD4C4J6_9BACI|nr:glycosyltransferase [Rossellomorea vietnamensis]UXH43433.1 glycosyltransferase [Rossellomorea vietnamensis]